MSPFSNHCDLFHRHLVLLLTVGACIATTGLSLYLLNRKRKRWVENVASIKSLFVYPIKSVPGVQVPVADVSPNGLSYAGIEDRSVDNERVISAFPSFANVIFHHHLQEHDLVEQREANDHDEARAQTVSHPNDVERGRERVYADSPRNGSPHHPAQAEHVLRRANY